MTLRIPAKVLLHVCSYDFYDMTLSTGKQRRHMINACTRQHFSNIISCLKQVIPYIKSKMKVINLINACILSSATAGKPITGSFKHTSLLEVSNTLHWKPLIEMGLLNL